MEDFNTYQIPDTIEADVLIMMSIKMMTVCHNHGLNTADTWNHFTAFGLAGEA